MWELAHGSAGAEMICDLPVIFLCLRDNFLRGAVRNNMTVPRFIPVTLSVAIVPK